MSAREIAHGRWSLGMPTHEQLCGCIWITDGDPVYPELDRQTRWCRQHDTARGEDEELR